MSADEGAEPIRGGDPAGATEYGQTCGTCSAPFASEDALRSHQEIDCSDGEPWGRGPVLAEGWTRGGLIVKLADFAFELGLAETPGDVAEVRAEIYEILGYTPVGSEARCAEPSE